MGKYDKFRYCDDITSLDLGKNPKLVELYVSFGVGMFFPDLKKLNVGEYMELNFLECSGNQLEELDVSNCSGLFTFDCSDNQIAALDLSHNSRLRKDNEDDVICDKDTVVTWYVGDNEIFED